MEVFLLKLVLDLFKFNHQLADALVLLCHQLGQPVLVIELLIDLLGLLVERHPQLEVLVG